MRPVGTKSGWHTSKEVGDVALAVLTGCGSLQAEKPEKDGSFKYLANEYTLLE